MYCPMCGKEMQTGYLQTGALTAFNRQRHRVSLNPKDPDDVMISRRAFTSADFNGFICKACGLVAFDYRNPLTRW